MSMSTSLGKEIWFIDDAPAANGVFRARFNFAAWLAVGTIGGAITLFASVGIHNAFREYQRQQCFKQLKRLGLAMHEYNEVHGHFPAPAIFGRGGKPLLSWRVELLPQLGYRSLYERFHLDEAWDSPHNLALLAEMPRELCCPGGPGRRAGQTSYMVIVGPENDGFSVNTAFEPTRGADIRHFVDGTSNTILVLETDAFVPWTKPDDLHWAKGSALPGIASPHPGGAHALFADGAARFLKATIDPNVLVAILTMNGYEVTSSS